MHSGTEQADLPQFVADFETGVKFQKDQKEVEHLWLQECGGVHSLMAAACNL